MSERRIRFLRGGSPLDYVKYAFEVSRVISLSSHYFGVWDHPIVDEGFFISTPLAREILFCWSRTKISRSYFFFLIRN